MNKTQRQMFIRETFFINFMLDILNQRFTFDDIDKWKIKQKISKLSRKCENSRENCVN